MTQPEQVDLTRTDETIEIGYRVMQMLAEGYDGQQITQAYDITPLRAKIALAAYANRILDGTVPPHPSPECGTNYNGWCMVHGVFHPAPRPAPDRAALLRTEMERSVLGDLSDPVIYGAIATKLPPGVEVEAPALVAEFPAELSNGTEPFPVVTVDPAEIAEELGEIDRANARAREDEEASEFCRVCGVTGDHALTCVYRVFSGGAR